MKKILRFTIFAIITALLTIPFHVFGEVSNYQIRATGNPETGDFPLSIIFITCLMGISGIMYSLKKREQD